MSRIIEKDLSDIQKDNMVDYYDEILLRRAIPDVRDGLKLIHRRILYSMNHLGASSTKKYMKSARIVGDVIGRLHPKGDSSIYDAIVNMTEDYSNSKILLDPHGNFGTIYGDPAAAMRYTEARLDKFAEEVMLDNLNDNSVNFVPNFDNTTKEPASLPAKLPMYVINGAFGIAAGYSVCFPPHNVAKTISKTIELIKNPDIDIEEFIADFHPDIPTGCEIINIEEAKDAYRTGVSKMVMRSTIDIDEKKHRLILRSVPYMKKLSTIRASIKEAWDEKQIPELKDVQNESRAGNIELYIYVKKDADLEMVRNKLYKFTQCQTTLAFNLIATKNDKFIIYDIKELIMDWVQYRKDTIKRIKMEYIRKHNYRIHLLDGLLIALHPDNIDTVIEIIKKAKSKQHAKDKLMEKYDFTEKQVDHITDIKLIRINQLEVKEIAKERDELQAKVDDEVSYLSNPSKIDGYIIDELTALGKKYGKAKQTTNVSNINTKDSLNIETIIPDKNYLIIFTRNNYLKKIESNIKDQKRGGKGLNIGRIKEDDVAKSILQVNSKDNILMFTNTGKVYAYKCYELQDTSIQSFGSNISHLVNGETVVNIINITNDELKNEDIHLLIATKMGKIKLTSILEFKRLGKSGMIATKLNDGDEVIAVEAENINNDFSVLALNSKGNAIHFDKTEIPVTLRPTFGSNIFDASEINEDNVIASLNVVTEDTKGIVVMTRDGLGKKVSMDEFPPQRRAGKGRIAIRLKGDDKAVKCLSFNEESNMVVISNTSIININTADIKFLLRPAYGVIIKRLADKETILDACMI